jgi:hypothetical protein
LIAIERAIAHGIAAMQPVPRTSSSA